MKIILSWDHAGFEAAGKLVAFLKEKDYQVEEFGPKEYTPTDDYPDFVIPAMKSLQEQPDSKGIVLCKNGVGVSLLANKFKGVRAALSFSPEHAKSARLDDDANVLALPTQYLSQTEINEVAQTFLEAAFSGSERHLRRLEKISLEEEKNFK